MLTESIPEHILLCMPEGSVASGAPSLAFLAYPASAHVSISSCQLGKYSEEDAISAWPWGWVCGNSAPSGAPWLPPFLWCALSNSGTQGLTPSPSGLAVSNPCMWVLWNTDLYQPVGVVTISALTSSHPWSLFSHCTLNSTLQLLPFLCHHSDIAPLPDLPFLHSYQCPDFLCLQALLATRLTRTFFTTRPTSPNFLLSPHSLNIGISLSPQLLMPSVPSTLFPSFLLGL